MRDRRLGGGGGGGGGRRRDRRGGGREEKAADRRPFVRQRSHRLRRLRRRRRGLRRRCGLRVMSWLSARILFPHMKCCGFLAINFDFCIRWEFKMVQFCLNLWFTGVNILSGNLCFVIFFGFWFSFWVTGLLRFLLPTTIT